MQRRRLVTRLVVLGSPVLLLTLFATSLLMSDAEWTPSGGEGKAGCRVTRAKPTVPPQITACFTFSVWNSPLSYRILFH